MPFTMDSKSLIKSIFINYLTNTKSVIDKALYKTEKFQSFRLEENEGKMDLER